MRSVAEQRGGVKQSLRISEGQQAPPRSSAREVRSAQSRLRRHRGRESHCFQHEEDLKRINSLAKSATLNYCYRAGVGKRARSPTPVAERSGRPRFAPPSVRVYDGERACLSSRPDSGLRRPSARPHDFRRGCRRSRCAGVPGDADFTALASLADGPTGPNRTVQTPTLNGRGSLKTPSNTRFMDGEPDEMRTNRLPGGRRARAARSRCSTRPSFSPRCVGHGHRMTWSSSRTRGWY